MRTIFVIVQIGMVIWLGGCTQPNANKQSYNGVQVTLKSADNGDGTYTNPIIQADYSDPDAIRLGDDFYMTASSFNCSPGLPLLHSTDLVNWQLIAYASERVVPENHYSSVQHGNGIWAPSLRYHNGEFYIFYGDPDFGIFMLKSKDVLGPWSKPLLIKEAKGWIDPCPFWDEDGNAYLVHAYAGSRAGIKSVLAVCRMKPDGTALLDDGVLVFDGHGDHPTVEGPKFYKRNGFYYIFAPAGGVSTGWQLVLRSKNIYGPYEHKTVMHRGDTKVNGPHQGAWINLDSDEDWFVHFQDQEAYGRVVHLQPVKWNNNWPVIGIGDGNTGEPVSTFQKPSVAQGNAIAPANMDDEFDTTPSLLWQWHGNNGTDWGKSFPGKGVFRMYCQPYPKDYFNLWDVHSLFMQKIPAVSFEATCKISANMMNNGERCGFVVMGMDYSGIDIIKEDDVLKLRNFTCIGAVQKSMEQYAEPYILTSGHLYLRLKITQGAVCQFYYSLDGNDFVKIGSSFTARPGRWIGAKLGFFAQKNNVTNDSGWMDIEWFRYKEI